MKRVDRPSADVVLAPDVLGKSFFDAACRRVLELWRDGGIRPVVTRDLLRAYAQLLETLGIPPPVIRQWALWFTSAEASRYIDWTAPNPCNTFALCTDAAELGKTRVVISRREEPPREEREVHESRPITWSTPSEYLASLAK